MPLTPESWRRTQRCRAVTGLSYAELVALVAIIAHYRAFCRPVTRRELADFLLQEEDLTCDGQIIVLLRANCIERCGNNQNSAYVPTSRGSQKVAAWRRVQVGEREPEAGAAE
jgi:hypothetical protein